MTNCSHGVPFEHTCHLCLEEGLERSAKHKPKSIKAKTCKVCKEKFIPRRPMQSCCSYPMPCEATKADQLAAKSAAHRAKSQRGETKQRLEAIKTLPELLKRCQIDFNKYINTRDADKPCIACDEPIRTVAHASHYLSVGARPNLRFSELNVHRGCSKCNLFLHGNLINFRINLIKRIGLEAVEALESDHTPKNYTRDQVNELAAHYRAKTRELLK